MREYKNAKNNNRDFDNRTDGIDRQARRSIAPLKRGVKNHKKLLYTPFFTFA